MYIKRVRIQTEPFILSEKDVNEILFLKRKKQKIISIFDWSVLVCFVCKFLK